MNQTFLSDDQIKELMSSDLSRDYILGSVYEVENVLLILKDIKEKVEYFKELKKYRTKSIDDKINGLTDRASQLRRVIFHTMKQLEPKKNTITFPSIGSVTRKKPKSSWSVDDEQSMVAFLDKQGYKDAVIKTKQLIDVRKLNNILDDFADARVTVPGVSPKATNESISIRFEENESLSVPVESRTSDVLKTLDALDNLSTDNL